MKPSVIRVTDEKLIKELIHLDGIWEDMQDGESPFEMSYHLWWLPILSEDGGIAGFAVAQWLGSNLVCWHGGLRKEYRGKESFKYGLAVKEWIKEHLPEVKHIVMLPTHKKAAIAFTKQLGFKETYTLKDAVVKDNKKYDKLLFEI